MGCEAFLEKKIGTICAVVCRGAMDRNSVTSGGAWKNERNAEARSGLVEGTTNSDSTTNAQHLEAKTGTICSVVAIASRDKPSYQGGKVSIVRTMYYATAVHGSTHRICDTVVNGISDQKMRGGIAG